MEMTKEYATKLVRSYTAVTDWDTAESVAVIAVENKCCIYHALWLYNKMKNPSKPSRCWCNDCSPGQVLKK